MQAFHKCISSGSLSLIDALQEKKANAYLEYVVILVKVNYLALSEWRVNLPPGDGWKDVAVLGLRAGLCFKQ